MIHCVDSDDRGNDLKMLFQFNRQLQADPNHPCQFGHGRRRHSERASGSEGGGATQDQGLLCLQELGEGAYHHGEAEPPQHRLLARGRLCQQLLLMSGRRLRPMEAISATRLEARVSGASSCLRRKAGGCSTVVSLSLATMAMKTIVTTKEAFELNYKREKQCLLRWPSVLFHPRPIFILAALQLWPSMQQVFLKFSHNDGDARLQQ